MVISCVLFKEVANLNEGFDMPAILGTTEGMIEHNYMAPNRLYTLIPFLLRLAIVLCAHAFRCFLLKKNP